MPAIFPGSSGGGGGDPTVGGDLSGVASNAQLVSGSVGTAELAAGAVTTAKLVDASVTTVKIADSNVTTAKINNGAVTVAKISPGSGGQVLLTSGGSAAWGTNAIPAGSDHQTYTTVSGTATWRDPLRINAAEYGTLHADVQDTAAGTVTSGSATLTVSTGAPFASGDVGKTIIVVGAGAGGADLQTTITSFNSTTSVTMSAAASTTVGSAVVTWGTDDSATIQAAINAVPSTTTGGCVEIPRGAYLILSSLTSSAPGLEIVGQGNAGQAQRIAKGGTRLVIGSGIIGLDYNAGGGAFFRGITLRSLHFQAAAQNGANGGVSLYNVSNSVVENVVCSDFIGTASYGFKIDANSGAGANSQYTEMRNMRCNRCHIGLWLAHANGTTLNGGYFDGNNNGSPSVNPLTGSTGIQVDSGDTFRGFGVKVQGYSTGVNFASGEGHELHGPRFEMFDLGLSIGATTSKNGLWGGTFVNALLGTHGTAIFVTSGAANTTLFPGDMSSTTAKITDNGTNTLYNTNTGTGPFMQHPGAIQGKQGLATKVKAGVPVDGDFVAFASDGLIALDSTNNRIYARVGGTWKYAALT